MKMARARFAASFCCRKARLGIATKPNSSGGSQRQCHGCLIVRKWKIIAAATALLVRPALAGPPYVSDDPEPTDYQHFEIYTFSNGTATRSDIGGASGIDFNYGAAPDLQLTATLPIGFDNPAAGGASFGPGDIELAAKYRFLHQDSFGLDVAFFPRVFLPSPTKNIGNNTASLLLPVWVQKDWGGGWSAFGGGGCVIGGAAGGGRFPAAPRRTFACPAASLPIRCSPSCSLASNFFTRPPTASERPRPQASGLAPAT